MPFDIYSESLHLANTIREIEYNYKLSGEKINMQEVYIESFRFNFAYI